MGKTDKKMDLKIEYIDVTKLKPYEKNARKHEEYDISQIAKSIEAYGFNDPIGIWGKDNQIVEGHGRLLAAKKLGMKEVPCIRLDDLTDEQRREYTIMHNKTAELSTWDFDMLEKELSELDFGGFDVDWGVGESEKKEKAEEGEVKFGEVIGEEHNYIVLFFDNDVDWLQAESLFELKSVICGSTRKDGKITKGMRRTGIGRVIKGAEAIEMLKNKLRETK